MLLYLVLVILFGLMAPSFLKKNLMYLRGGQGFMNTRLREADTTRNIDILFMGSSHSYRGYDPRIFLKNGQRTFNLGSSAQTPIQTKVLIDTYLDKLKPKLVVLDTYPLLFQSDGVESSLDLLSNGRIDGALAKMTLEVNSIRTYNTLIYSYFRQLAHLDKDYAEAHSRGLDSYVPGGYVEKRIYPRRAPRVGKTLSVDLDGKQFEAFKSIVATLQQRHIDYVIVQSPLPGYTYASFANNQEFDAAMHNLGKYFNMNTILDLPDEMFLDDDHLNQKGVAKFNETLIDLLNDGKLANGSRLF